MSDEIESLNIGDLDIEELEQRIELGQMIPPSEDPADDCTDFTCTTFGRNCGTFRVPQ